MAARFRSSNCWTLPSAAVAAVVAWSVFAPAADPPAGGDDLRALQGTWERTLVLPEPPGQPAPGGRVVKVVSGNRETVTTYDRAGQQTYGHAVEFRLERQGEVRVFTFFNREVTAGPAKGQRIAEPSSYIYRVRDDTFEEVWGFLPGQEKRELLAARWKRAGRQ
jgi:hypothetical protein